MSDSEREIPADHSAWLRQALGQQDHDELPKKLVEKYWEMKRVFDRLGAIVTGREIAFLVWQMGYGKPTAKEDRPPSVVDLYRKKQIKLEAPVEVKFRDKWMGGVLKGVTGNDELVVQPVGEADERKFAVEQVRLPSVAA